MVLSTVVTTSFTGLDSFDRMRFCFFAGHPSLSLREKETGGKGDISPFHLIAQPYTGIVVLSTVVSTYFLGVDSFDKMRFRFIAGHLSLLLQGTVQGVKGDVLPFDMIAWCQTRIVVLSTVVPISFVGVESLDKTRFRFYCIDIFHFKICLHYLPPPPVIIHEGHYCMTVDLTTIPV